MYLNSVEGNDGASLVKDLGSSLHVLKYISRVYGGGLLGFQETLFDSKTISLK